MHQLVQRTPVAGPVEADLGALSLKLAERPVHSEGRGSWGKFPGKLPDRDVRMRREVTVFKGMPEASILEA